MHKCTRKAGRDPKKLFLPIFVFRVFHQSTPFGPLFHNLIFFPIWFRIRCVIRILNSSYAMGHCVEPIFFAETMHLSRGLPRPSTAMVMFLALWPRAQNFSQTFFQFGDVLCLESTAKSCAVPIAHNQGPKCTNNKSSAMAHSAVPNSLRES
jgi:hypothetical protein